MPAFRPSARAQRGLSLVELLVTMAITLIATVIIFQVFEVSEGIKRTTSTGGDAQQNGAIALYVMERDLRNAGQGINDSGVAGCTLVGYDANIPGALPGGLVFAPARIVFGADDTVPDQIVMFYGGQMYVTSATTITADLAAASTQMRVTGRYGVRTGDLIVVLEPSSTKNCVLREVTGLPAAPDTDVIQHGTSSYPYTVGATTSTVAPRFNAGGGLPAAYGGAATPLATKIYNLGNRHDGKTMPVYITYSIAGGSLQSQSLFNPGVTNAVADNIVHMKAQYVMADGTFSTAATPAWDNVVGIRLAVLARSQLAERPSSGIVSDPCDTTVAEPTWAGGTFEMDNTIGAGEDWKCYRYRVFETSVPMRNWIWKSS